MELSNYKNKALDVSEKANVDSQVDSQVETAKKYPRDTRRSTDKAVEMATMTKEIARSCGYALFREGKFITGPSVHLAKIIIYNWGNIKSEAKVIRRTDKEIVSRGTCWDLETNISASFEVSRSIVDNRGKRYSEDIIVATGNAVNSISLRNAIFAVVPRVITDIVYLEAQRYITGDLSDDNRLLKTRTEIINNFKKHGIKEDEIIKLCGKQTLNQIYADEIYVLICVLQSLKDGDTTVAEITKGIRTTTEEVTDKKKEMKEKKKTEKVKPAKLP